MFLNILPTSYLALSKVRTHQKLAITLLALVSSAGIAQSSSDAVNLRETGAPASGIAIQPRGISVHSHDEQNFSATLPGGTAPTDVVWEVNGIPGGNDTVGRISPQGTYTAPAAVPETSSVTISARSATQSSVAASTTVNVAAGLKFYVATTGNDNNPGSLAQPWRHIQHAAQKAQPGDIVYVRAGVYNEAVTVGVSGSASVGPITFESYPGEKAIVDGTGLKVADGQSGLFDISDRNYVVISGFEIRNFTSNSDSNVPVGIYLHGADSNIQILNNHVHNITTTGPANADNCASDALAIAVYGDSAPAAITSLTISGNEVDHNQTGCSETVTLNGNVNGFSVTKNLIHDNNNIGIDVIGFEGTSPQAAYDQARNGTISGNTIYNITSYGNPDYGDQYAADGIYVDGGTQITIEKNTVHNADLNIELASEHKGKVTSYVTLRNNLIYDGNSNGISIGGYDKSVGGTDHCTIVNNTLYNNDTKQTGSGEFQIQYYATNNIFENNIVYANSQNLFLNSYTNSESTPVTSNHNVWYSSNEGNSNWQWNGASYTGFTSYVAKTRQDATSKFANPMFVSTSTPNLQVQSGSPAINMGADLGTTVVGTVDVVGAARVIGSSIDAGAYEH